MAKDYSKIKAMAQEILKCIGDEPEGENPQLPEQEESSEDDAQYKTGEEDASVLAHKSLGNQEPLMDFTPAAEDDKNLPSYADSASTKEEGKRKKRDDDSISILARTLASKFNR